MSELSGPSRAAVETWIADVEADLEAVEAQTAPLLARQAALTERVGLLRRLLNSLGPDTTSGNVTMPADATVAAGRAGTTVRERVQTDAIAILRDTASPMHINDIHAEFIKRGFEVPGAGKPNNITAHLADAPGIRSTTRGVYTLSDGDSGLTAIRYPVIDQSKAKGSHG